jgi:protein SCO1
MTNRREMLANLGKGAIAIPAVALLAQAATDQNKPCSPTSRPGGPSARYFPNVVVRTHENEKALFYDDLVKGKIVMINFFSVTTDAVYPVTQNLATVQRLLGDRVGREVFMISITTDPEHDTSDVLKEFAKKHGVKPGWVFVTGKPADMQRLRESLFVQRGDSTHAAHHMAQDCSRGLVRYGNEALCRWGSFPARGKPENIVKRIPWVEMRKGRAS